MAGGTLRMRAPLLFAVGAIFAISIGLAAELCHSLVAAAWQLKNTTDATAATHFALVGGSVFGGFAALHYWFPKMTGRTMGESLARISFWTIARRPPARLRAARSSPAPSEGQVIDAYKFFDSTGVNAYNLIASIGVLVLAVGILLTLVNAIFSREGGPEAGHDPWGGEIARVVRALAAGAAQLRRPARRPQRPADARHPRGDRPSHPPRAEQAAGARFPAGSLSNAHAMPAPARRPRPPRRQPRLPRAPPRRPSSATT